MLAFIENSSPHVPSLLNITVPSLFWHFFSRRSPPCWISERWSYIIYFSPTCLTFKTWSYMVIYSTVFLLPAEYPKPGPVLSIFSNISPTCRVSKTCGPISQFFILFLQSWTFNSKVFQSFSQLPNIQNVVLYRPIFTSISPTFPKPGPVSSISPTCRITKNVWHNFSWTSN